LVFSSEAGALLYLQLKGWEICGNKIDVSGSVSHGDGSVSTTNRWVIRKPCSREEAEEIVRNTEKE
ncbi:MAG TPA: hypothetical protein VIQ97_01940, partial [Prevotella sp.]